MCIAGRIAFRSRCAEICRGIRGILFGSTLSLSRFDDFFHRIGTIVPGYLITFFERRGDVGFWREKNRHLREPIADRDGFDIRRVRNLGRIRNERERLVFGKLERFFAQFVPDRLVNPLRVAGTWWKKVDDQKMNSLPQQIERFFDERTERRCAAFIAGRNDLDHRDDRSRGVTDRDSIGDECVNVFVVGLKDEASFRRRLVDRDSVRLVDMMSRFIWTF